MSISYKVAAKKPRGVAGEQPVKYYPVLTDRSIADSRYVMEIISGRTSFSRGDVMGMIQCLVELIPELLKDGKNVRLDGLGTFSVHARSKGKDTPEAVTLRDIDSLKISFLPDKEIKKEMKNTQFVKKK